MGIWEYAIVITVIIIIAGLAFYIGRKLAPQKITESKTTTFLIIPGRSSSA